MIGWILELILNVILEFWNSLEAASNFLKRDFALPNETNFISYEFNIFARCL